MHTPGAEDVTRAHSEFFRSAQDTRGASCPPGEAMHRYFRRSLLPFCYSTSLVRADQTLRLLLRGQCGTKFRLQTLAKVSLTYSVFFFASQFGRLRTYSAGTTFGRGSPVLGVTQQSYDLDAAYWSQ